MTIMPVSQDDSMPSTSSAPSSSERVDDLAPSIITPFSTATTLSVTPAETSSNKHVSDATAELRKRLDKKLEACVLAEERTPSPILPAKDLPNKDIKTLPNFECAFGFCGRVDEPGVVPETKDAFITVVKTELGVISGAQKGLVSYQTAINSRKYHTFSTEFLIHENTAIIITLDQLDQISVHLKKIETEVEATGNGNKKVRTEALEAFRQAQRVVMRIRALLRHCHVFYKINFVLASDKKPTLH